MQDDYQDQKELLQKTIFEKVGNADAPLNVNLVDGLTCPLCGEVQDSFYSPPSCCAKCVDDLKAIILERRNSKK